MANIQNHKDLVGAVAAQVATLAGFKVPRPLLSGDDCFAPSTLSIRPTVNEEQRPDHTGRMGLAGSIVHAGDVECEVGFGLKPRAAAAVQDTSRFFDVGIFDSGLAYANSAKIDSGGTVTSFVVSQISGIESGMVIPIPTTSASGKYALRLVVGVSGTTGKGLVIVQPALSAAAPQGGRVMPSTTHEMSNDDNYSSLTLARWWSDMYAGAWGFVPNTYGVSWGNNTHPMMTLAGPARGYTFGAPVSLASAIATSGATTVKLLRADRMNSHVVVQIDSEVMKLGAKLTSNTYAVALSARGLLTTDSSSHLTGLKVTPYKPSPTIHGVQVKSPRVCVTVGTTSSIVIKLEGTEGSANWGDAIARNDADFCDDWRMQSYSKTDGDLHPDIAVVGRLTHSAAEHYQLANDATTRPVVVQMGNDRTDGMCGFVFPQALIQTNEPGAGDGKGAIQLTTRMQARGTIDDLDVMYYVEA
jgi:hypothetical protein